MNKRVFGKRSLAFLAAFGLILSVTATVLADAANPDSGVTAQVSGLTVTLSGTWQWTRDCESGTLKGDRDVGFAVDWNDPDAPGNLVVAGLDVGTPTDNLVYLRAIADQGTCSGGDISSGPWGVMSHTYTKAGTYDVCAVMYDVDIKGAPPTTGNHSIQAGGSGHNTDNSAEENSFEEGVQCAQATIVIPPLPTAVPTAQQSVLAATGTPAASTANTALSQNGVSPLPTVAFSLILLAALATLAYANVKTVRNRS